MDFIEILRVTILVLKCVLSSEVNDSTGCQKNVFRFKSSERNERKSIVNPESCMRESSFGDVESCFQNGTSYMPCGVESLHANLSTSPSSYISHEEERYGPRKENVKGADFSSTSSDRQSSEGLLCGASPPADSMIEGAKELDDIARFNTSTPVESGKFSDTCFTAGSSKRKHFAFKCTTQPVKNDSEDEKIHRIKLPSNRTNTGLVPLAADQVRVIHQGNYCPERSSYDLCPYTTTVMPFRIEKRCCKDKKGPFLRMERRFKSAMNKVKKENEGRIERLLTKYEQDLDKLKRRSEEKIRAHREHFNQQQIELLDILGRYGQPMNVCDSVNDLGGGLLVKNGVFKLKPPMSKQELNMINIQWLNLIRLHKFEEVFLREQLETEKHHLFQLHDLLLRNFRRLRFLKHQYTNLSLYIQEAKMLRSIDDLMRKKRDDVITTLKDELESSDFLKNWVKRKRTRIRRYIKKNSDTIHAYYKERRKEIKERYFYKTFISEQDLKIYYHLLEKVDKSEKKDVDVLLASTSSDALETRNFLDKVYEIPEKARNKAMEKNLYNTKTIKDYIKLGSMDFEIEKKKVLIELEDNVVAEKSMVDRNIELEIEKFEHKKDEQVYGLGKKQTEEMNEFNKLLTIY